MAAIPAPVFVISVTPSLSAVLRLERVRAAHPGARVVLLTKKDAQGGLTRQADEVWSEGMARGPARFLRLCVWPRPQWHALEP